MTGEPNSRPHKALGPAGNGAATAAAGSEGAAPARSLLSRPAWRAATIAFALGFAAIVALFHNTAESIVSIWFHDTTFNHGFLILPICLYLAWLRRDELARMTPEPTGWALVPLAASGGAWLLGAAANVNVVQHFALLFMLWSLFVGVFGWRVSRYLAFPLAYAAFAVPFGTFLVPPLQEFTATFAVKGIELLGIPIYRDGFLLSLPNGNFEVAEACAGIRFLIATLALGFLFAQLTYRSYWRKAAFLALCVVVPILSNGLRALGVVLIGYVSDMTMAVGFDHIVYGWLLFAMVTVILLAVGMAFRDRDLNDVPPAPPSAVGRPRAGTFRVAAVAAVCIAVAAVYPAYAELVIRAVPPDRPIALAAPTAGNGWSAVANAGDSWQPVFPGADATLMQAYRKDGRTVRLFVAYYRYQRPAAEVVSFRNKIVDDKAWRRARDEHGHGPRRRAEQDRRHRPDCG